MGENLHASRRWEITLGPYELRSFAVAGDIGITVFSDANLMGDGSVGG
ncbi:MAG: hypothetical protein ACYDH9_12920 [Limisphaerales bacterium]